MEDLKRTLTREELHRLVWSKPVQTLAELYGLSDRGLSKICQRHLVPVPSRGYWAKLEAGQVVRATPLRPIDNPALQIVHIGNKPQPSTSPYFEMVLAAARLEISQEQPLPPPSSAPDKARDLPSSKTNLAGSHLAHSSSMNKLHHDVLPFIAELKGLKPDRDGFLYFKYVKVPPRDVPRVGALLSELASRLADYGFAFDYRTNRVGFMKEGVSVDFRIEAPRKRSTEIHDSGWKHFTYSHVGRLTFQIYGWADGIKKQWADIESKLIEDSLEKIVESFRLNHVVEREREERRRVEEDLARHMAHRRKLAEQRSKREDDRLAYLRWLVATKQEINELKSAVSHFSEEHLISGDCQRMIEWTKNRVLTLEQRVAMSSIEGELVEKMLFPAVDDLNDPEGDLPLTTRW